MTTQLTLQTANLIGEFAFFTRTMIAPSGTTRKAPTARATFGKVVVHLFGKFATRTALLTVKTAIRTCFARTTIANFIRTIFHTIATATSIMQIVALVVTAVATATFFHTIAICLRYSVFDVFRKSVLLFVIF